MVVLVGNVEPQTGAVRRALAETVGLPPVIYVEHPDDVGNIPWMTSVRLVIVAGWPHLIPAEVLNHAPTVGFHSAKLPEYPGRAPIPWTLLRGDTHAYNTMLYLDEGIDSGDVIDQEAHYIEPGETPESLYRWVAESDVRLLKRHLPGLLAGNAPRTPQDPSKRGPLTTADGWQRHAALPRYTP